MLFTTGSLRPVCKLRLIARRRELARGVNRKRAADQLMLLRPALMKVTAGITTLSIDLKPARLAGLEGVSMLQLSHDIDCQFKTAFVLPHKLREALAVESEGRTLGGEVEVDGAYFAGNICSANNAKNRVDRRKAEHQPGTRRVVVAFRQRKGRTLPFVVHSEAEGVELTMQHVSRMAIMHAD